MKKTIFSLTILFFGVSVNAQTPIPNTTQTDETTFAIEYEINSGIEGQQSNANGLIEIGSQIVSLENIYGNNFNQTDLKIRNKSNGELLYSETLSNSYDDYYNIIKSVPTEDSSGYYFAINKSGYDNDTGENITSSLIYIYNSEGLTLLNTLSSTSTSLLVFDSGSLFLIDSNNLNINKLNLSNFSVDEVFSLNFDKDNFTTSKVFQLDETTFILRGNINSGNYNNDVFLSKFDLSAQIFWEKVIDGNRDDRINAIKLINNEIFLCGKSLSYDGIFADEYGDGIEWGDEPFKSNWVMKLDSSGDILWSKLFNPSWYQQSSGQFFDIFEGDSFVLLGGSTYNNYDFHSQFENHYNEDLYSVKLDFEGNLIWEKTYGGFNNQVFSSMGVVNDQIIYTTNLNRWNFFGVGGGFSCQGQVSAEVNGKFNNPLSNENQTDIWIFATDLEGEIQWDQFYGGEKSDFVNNIIYNSDRIYINATTKSIDYDVVSLIGIQDSWFFKLRPNNRPEGNDDIATVLEDSGLTTLKVLENDIDIDGDDLIITEVSTSGSGTINISSNGTSIDYTPAFNFNGTEIIEYTVSDGEAIDSPIILTITVTAVNDAPVSVEDTLTVLEDVETTSIDVITNDTDIEDDTLILIAVSTTGSGEVDTNADGLSVDYTPALNFNGTETITYTVSDGELTDTKGTLTITVTAVNDAPVAISDTAKVLEDATLTSIDVIANDTDIDEDVLTITAVSSSGSGTVAINADGLSVDYTPALNFNGTETITYTVSDGVLTDTTGTLTITVAPVNDAPVSVNDIIELNEGGLITILQNNELSLLHNDSDIDEDDLSTFIVDSPLYGELELNLDGTFSYQHDGFETISDSFTYKSNDGDLDSNTSTVTIIINPVNDNSPSNISISNNSIEENISNATVGQLSTTDLDLPSDSHTFELISGEGDNDNDKFSIDESNLNLIISLDYESESNNSIRIRVTDENDNSYEDSITINVIDVNDINITSEVIGSYCSGGSGSGSVTINSINDVTGDVFFSWSAENGGVIPSGQENNQNLSDLSAGTYTLNLSNNEFSYTEQFEVGLTSQYDQLSICYVTSDESNDVNNRIFLNNQGNYNVNYYEILRESNIANEYESIGQVASSENSFLDDSSNNMSQSYSYKVRLMDNCGSKSSNSEAHKSILLQSSVSLNNSVNLNWSHYKGVDIQSYNIYRKKNEESFQIIGSVSSNNNSYNDSTADITQNNYEYYISISVDNCLTELKGKSSSKIKSNLQNLGAFLSLNNHISNDELSVYPNPSKNKIKIKIKGNLVIVKSKIYDNLGKEVFSTKESSFSVKALSSSSYYIKIFTSKGIAIRRFIKE